NSSRWYPGGGLYRNVWLTKTHPVHVGQWGTFITTREVSKTSATIDIAITIDNQSKDHAAVDGVTHIYELNQDGIPADNPVAILEHKAEVTAGGSMQITTSTTISHPKLWGPPPTQTPHLYVAVTSLYLDGVLTDQYETTFGIRSLRFDANSGVYVNGEHITLKGANQHHDLGALGAAFNVRAAERQLEVLREMGCNAIRMAHNPPAPELLDLTD